MLLSTIFSVAVKALQAVASFATVHKLVELWGTGQYGLWVTLTALAAYISLFDFGIGYGIKNRVAEAAGQMNLAGAEAAVQAGAVIYLSAAVVALLGGVVLITQVAPFSQHVMAASILWGGCLVTFVLSLHSNVLQGLGRFKTLAAVSLLTPGIWFTALQLWPRDRELSMVTASSVFAAAMVSQGLATWAASRAGHRFAFKGLRKVDRAQVASLMRLGLQFFALQAAAFALGSLGSILVYRFLGGSQTAQYDSAAKTFSILNIVFSMLVSIAWTEISKAKSNRDVARLYALRRTLHLAALAFVVVAIGTCFFSAEITKALTGISVEPAATAGFAAMTCIQVFAYASAVFLNAFEKLRVQIIFALISIPLFLVTAMVLLRSGVGIDAIPLASAAALFPSLLACAWLARKLISQFAADSVPPRQALAT